MTPEEQEKKELERIRLMNHLPTNGKGTTLNSIPSHRNDGYGTTPNPLWQEGLKESQVTDIPQETKTHSVSRKMGTMGESGSDIQIKAKIDVDAMNAWSDESEELRDPKERKDDRMPVKIDEEQDQLQEQQRQRAQEQGEEIDTQLTTALSSQRIMKGTLATAAVGGTAIGIGGLAYFVSGSDSTAFIHAIRHLIA